ncbi:hypothetical protein Chor_012678, partial [Crotalus horridus]
MWLQNNNAEHNPVSPGDQDYRIVFAWQGLPCCHDGEILEDVEANRTTELGSGLSGKYILFSKNQLVEALVKEFHSSSREERISFLQFVSQVDLSLVHYYYSVLEQVQTPIDPDRDKLQEFCFKDAEWLRKEQGVLAKMEPLLDQANFNKLSEEALAYALIVNHPHDEVQVTVNLDQYEYITFWALGQRIGPLRVMAATRAQRTGFFGTAWIPADRQEKN